MQVFQSTILVVNKCPFYNSKVAAGFPSPADDHMDRKLDLNEHLIDSPSSTFFIRATGESMSGAGIHDGSLLIVDKAAEPRHNKIVIAVIDGEFTIKRLKVTKNGFLLVPENPNYQPIKLNENSSIWGVVTSIINQV
jgi:DNA polymerase V